MTASQSPTAALVAELREHHGDGGHHYNCEFPTIAACEAESICGCCTRRVGYPCLVARAADALERVLALVDTPHALCFDDDLHDCVTEQILAALAGAGPVPGHREEEGT